jgi:hypothetical protein
MDKGQKAMPTPSQRGNRTIRLADLAADRQQSVMIVQRVAAVQRRNLHHTGIEIDERALKRDEGRSKGAAEIHNRSARRIAL